VITLTRGALQLSVDPNHGGCIRTAFLDNDPILRPAPGNTSDPLLMGCYPCVPYFGRITQPVIRDGFEYQLSPTHVKHFPQTPIHGEGWLRHWNIVAQTGSAATIETSVQNPEAGRFPVAWSARQEFSVFEHGFDISLTLTNIDSVPALMGAGLHPFLTCPSDATLLFDYEESRCPQVVETLPLSPGLFKTSDPLPAHLIDHTFLGVRGPIQIHRGSARAVSIQTNESAIHLYRPEDGSFICVEPVTHLPGALHHGHSHAPKPLDARASLRLEMKITVEV